MQKSTIGVIVVYMSVETVHYTERTIEENPTSVLNRTFTEQTGVSEQRKGSLGTFWNKVVKAAVGFGAVWVAGSALSASQETTFASSTGSGENFFSVATNGGWINSVGTALADVGLLGLFITAGAALGGLLRSHRQNNEIKR